MMVNEEIKKLVLVRLESMPSNIKIALGSGEQLSKERLIEHVKNNDQLGKMIVDMQLKYLKSMKTGFI